MRGAILALISAVLFGASTPLAKLLLDHISPWLLAMGYLLRRNILTYKAPPNNEGYDLICIHPDPRVSSRQIRIQVKSRLATDSDRGFPVKARTFEAFDYVMNVQLNVGFFFRKRRTAVEPGRLCARPGSPTIN